MSSFFLPLPIFLYFSPFSSTIFSLYTSCFLLQLLPLIPLEGFPPFFFVLYVCQSFLTSSIYSSLPVFSSMTFCFPFTLNYCRDVLFSSASWFFLFKPSVFILLFYYISFFFISFSVFIPLSVLHCSSLTFAFKILIFILYAFYRVFSSITGTVFLICFFFL